ncbi:aminotransferase class III-fold pyridoxal phosphate-dependent enzyme [Inediibacterium massiliense]|uniref:aminotransferase class III-fold pyridoxal phosphate-dependent enzyme n=1 Tax=Inediibacterium massiliense TaxID=1658111 RepID=UPI0006B49BB5|nr:aminotransferase class III-fold pyridoxal phosphate-dependent enzyme [Inediibacterium massiliense]
MALAVTTDHIYNAFYADYNEQKAFMHSHTYCGNPLACSAALEVLNILDEENILAKAKENGKYFHELIQETFSNHPYVGDIRSIGLINAIELVEDTSKKKSFDSKKRIGYEIYKKALKMGILLRPLGDVIYFNPPLIIEKKDMDIVTQICKKAIDNILK